MQNGQFKATLMLPPNLTFNTPGAQVIAYAWNGPSIALGCNDSILFHGTDTSVAGIKDSAGPQINIRPIYDTSLLASTAVSYADHLSGSLPLSFEILLSSPIGLNVSGAGPDQGLTMEVPGILARENISSKFQFAAGNCQKGSAVVVLQQGSVKEGNYTLCITAQDLIGKVSKATFGLAITDSNTLSLDHVCNMPNPMRMGATTRYFFSPSTTQWYHYGFTSSGLSSLNVTLKIYSLRGRLLKVIQDLQNGQVWDGRDQTGYQLPPDVYLYQMSASYSLVTSNTTSSLQTVKSKIQKLVIYPPR